MKAKISLLEPFWLVMLSSAAEAISLTDMQFRLSEDGLILSKLDASKAAYLRVFIPASEFHEYEIDDELTVCISGLEFAKAIKALKKSKNPLLIEIGTSEFKLSDEGNLRRIYNMTMLTPMEEQKRPKLELDTKMIVDGSECYSIINDLSDFSNFIIIDARESMLLIHTEGDQTDFTVQTTLEESPLLKEFEGKEGKSVYSGVYLKPIFKMLKDHEEVNVSFSEDKPIKISITKDDASIEFVVAPRVERK